MKRVLYLSYDGMTDPLGQSQVLPYLSGLSKEGYEIHLISFEKTEKFTQHKETIQALCDQAGINWHPLSYTKNPPLLSTIYDVRRMKNLAHKLHKENSFQIIHCRSYISALVGRGMKRKYGTKFLFDMRGFWADERVEGNIWKLSNPLFKTVYNYFKRKEISFFKGADHTVSLTYNGKKEIESWKEFSTKVPTIDVIPCCVDLELFDPKKIKENNKTTLRKKINVQEEDFILGYVGSIGTWYMLPEMLDYYKVLKTEQPSAKFLFVTGEQASTIINLAKEKGISENDLIITSCLHSEVPLFISLFNASIFFIRPTFSKKASSPTKQGEIMAMGIPLICNAGIGDTDYVVGKYNSGIVLKDLSSEKYHENLNIKDHFNIEKTMKGAKEFYGLEEGVKRYLAIYQRLTSK